jgi:predicted  nucleic acid-binding Zn-ribbon protein
MEKPINEPFTSEESQEIYKNFKTIINSRLDKLYNSNGSDGEQYAYSIAVKQMRNKQANKTEEPTIEKPMEDVKLKEMVRAALTEKPRPDYPDIDKDGDREESMEKAAQDKKKMQKEDLDLGHEDNEPHMLKADLYRIGKYAMELYKMVDQFEGEQEIDFPHWWQAKVIEAKNLLISAKHYLDFETKESQLDAMVNVASEEGAIDEEMTPQQSQKKGMPFKNVAEKEATKKKIKEAILAKLKQK